jgi:AhpD family alkylhydroperoxidase
MPSALSARAKPFAALTFIGYLLVYWVPCRTAPARALSRISRPGGRRWYRAAEQEGVMATVKLIEYADGSAEVRAVYDDIMATRKVDRVNNFWKALASHPPTLRRTWETLKSVMAPGALDPLTKEMIYLAVSATNGCRYCIASHTASARGRGMTEPMLGELMAVVGMANETNSLADGYQIEVDEMLRTPA